MTMGERLQRYFHDQSGCIVLRKDGRKTLLKCSTGVAGAWLFVKIYHHAGQRGLFPFLAALSAGERHYRTSRRLVSAGISIPTPCGAAVRRNRWGVIEQSLFASVWVDDMLPLKELTVMRNGMPSLKEPELRALNRSLGAFLAALHQRRVRAYDVNSGNFLVRAAGPDNYRIMLVDLENITFRCSISRNQRIRNLAQLAACMLPLSSTAAADLCEGYGSVISAFDDAVFAGDVHDRALAVQSLWKERLNASFAQIAAVRGPSPGPGEGR